MSRTKIEKMVKRREGNEQTEQKTDEASERQQKKLTGGVKKMKKSIRKIERRTRGRDIDGNDRMRWRLRAANDAAIQAWRAAA